MSEVKSLETRFLEKDVVPVSSTAKRDRLIKALRIISILLTVVLCISPIICCCLGVGIPLPVLICLGIAILGFFLISVIPSLLKLKSPSKALEPEDQLGTLVCSGGSVSIDLSVGLTFDQEKIVHALHEGVRALLGDSPDEIETNYQLHKDKLAEKYKITLLNGPFIFGDYKSSGYSDLVFSCEHFPGIVFKSKTVSRVQLLGKLKAAYESALSETPSILPKVWYRNERTVTNKSGTESFVLILEERRTHFDMIPTHCSMPIHVNFNTLFPLELEDLYFANKCHRAMIFCFGDDPIGRKELHDVYAGSSLGLNVGNFKSLDLECSSIYWDNVILKSMSSMRARHYQEMRKHCIQIIVNEGLHLINIPNALPIVSTVMLPTEDLENGEFRSLIMEEQSEVDSGLLLPLIGSKQEKIEALTIRIPSILQLIKFLSFTLMEFEDLKQIPIVQDSQGLISLRISNLSNMKILQEDDLPYSKLEALLIRWVEEILDVREIAVSGPFDIISKALFEACPTTGMKEFLENIMQGTGNSEKLKIL